jgi:hypothetical protein
MRMFEAIGVYPTGAYFSYTSMCWRIDPVPRFVLETVKV